SARPAPNTSTLRELLPRGADLLVDVTAVDRVAVAGEGAGPRRDRLVVAPHLREHVAIVLLHDRVRRQLIGRALHVLEREIELAVLEVRPADAIQIRAVVRLDGKRALQIID